MYCNPNMLAIIETVALIICIALTLLFIFSCYIIWDVLYRFIGCAFKNKKSSIQELRDRDLVYVYVDSRVTKRPRRVSGRKKRQQRASAGFCKKLLQRGLDAERGTVEEVQRGLDELRENFLDLLACE